jgi:hypothetical protein
MPMPNATLIIVQPGHPTRKVRISDGPTSVGRALDNAVCLDDDSNVSRYHAEIEARGGDFWVVDLGSSNGTTVNDEPVEFERPLREGDLICVGGSTVIEFRLRGAGAPASRPEFSYGEAAAAAAAPEPAAHDELATDVETSVAAADPEQASPPPPPAPPVRTTTGPSAGVVASAVGGGLLLTAVAALILSGRLSGGCSPVVRVVSPQTGSAVRGPLNVRVEAEDARCIERVVYQLDGVEVASAQAAPYEVVLDPARLAGFGSGVHVLSVTVEDERGGRKVQPDTVLLTLRGGDGTPVSSNQTGPPSGPTPQASLPPPPSTGSDALRSMSERLAGQISRKSGFVFDRDLVELIRARSGEYRVSGFSDRARRHRREINKAFRDQGLDPLLGYVLAMSRSKFDENASGEGVGLWQMPFAVAQAQGYLQPGETEAALKDPRRSAEIAAAYTKALLNTFESVDDFMYAVACFGMPLNQVGQVRTQLASAVPDPGVRRDFLKVVKSGIIKGEQLDRVVRFFAAGVVCENPQEFGLRGEQPFSTLF